MIDKFLACWLVQAESGCAVTPPRVNPPGRKLNEEQNVQGLHADRLDGEEISSQNAMRLSSQEPGPARAAAMRGRADAMFPQDPP